MQKAKAAYTRLSGLLHRNSTLSISRKVLIVFMIIRPILTYALPCWANVPISFIKKMSGYINRITPCSTISVRYVEETLLSFIYIS